MMGVLFRRRSGFHQVLDANALARTGRCVGAQIGLAGVCIDRRAASARHHTIDPIRRRASRVPLGPMIEQVIVTRDQ